MKVAYWPGCVSRGFTPELHGSMALVAERLGIELVELDRANCCGAGVIAEHNPELADTLNARTFAMAQKTGHVMMNICSTCQGSQSECQERLDADSGYRDHINEVLRRGGLHYEPGITNKNFLWLLVEDFGLDQLRDARQATAGRPARGPVLRLLRAAADHAARLPGAPRARPLPRVADRGARRRGRGVRRRAQVLRVPRDHDEPRDLTESGRPPHRRCDRRGRRRARDAVPAVPPQPRPAAARRRQGRRAATSACRCCTCPSSSASRSASSRRSWG